MKNHEFKLGDPSRTNRFYVENIVVIYFEGEAEGIVLISI